MASMARTRRVVVLMGLLLIVAGIGFLKSEANEPYFPWLWPWWLLAAGASCLMFAWQIQSATWWKWSRILVVLGALSRACVVAMRWSAGTTSGWMSLAGICFTLIAAAALFEMWTIDLRYWSRRADLADER